MNATLAVAQFLNISPNQIKRCDEWAKVYFVVVVGLRPTFLSKKIVDRSFKLRLGYTVAGDPVVKDEQTGKCYILRSPGHYTDGSWGIKEITSSKINQEVDFSDIRGEIHRAKVKTKPQTLRELMVFKAISYAWNAK